MPNLFQAHGRNIFYGIIFFFFFFIWKREVKKKVMRFTPKYKNAGFLNIFSSFLKRQCFLKIFHSDRTNANSR